MRAPPTRTARITSAGASGIAYQPRRIEMSRPARRPARMGALSTPARRSAASGSAPPLRRMSSSGGLSGSRVICRALPVREHARTARHRLWGAELDRWPVEEECNARNSGEWDASPAQSLLRCNSPDLRSRTLGYRDGMRRRPRIRSARTDACARPERMRRTQLRRSCRACRSRCTRSSRGSRRCSAGRAARPIRERSSRLPTASGWRNSTTRVQHRSRSPRAMRRADCGSPSASTSSGRSARRRPDPPRSNSSRPRAARAARRRGRLRARPLPARMRAQLRRLGPIPPPQLA